MVWLTDAMAETLARRRPQRQGFGPARILRDDRDTVRMAYHFRFGPVDLLRCRFSLSPRWETQEAVRVLRDARRQAYHLPWLRRIRAAADTLDLRPLWLLMPRKGHHPDFLSPPPLGPCVTIEEELARVRATDPEAAA